MTEPDDRLVGDDAWELYPAAERPWRTRLRRAVGWMPVVGVGLIVWPPLAILAICLAAGWDDLVRGATGASRVGDPDVRAVTRRFDLAWGVWKIAATGAGLMFATIWIAAALESSVENRPMQPPDTFVAAALTFLLGFPLSAILTAAGLSAAWRAGLRVWIGQGVNQARTLLLGMLVVGFTVIALVPVSVLLVAIAGGPGPVYGPSVLLFTGIVLVGLFGGPIVLLLILDWLSARILAATPSKFGAKTAAVGKWAAPDAVGGRVA